MPGVEEVSFGTAPLLGFNDTVFWIDGQPRPESASQMNWTITSLVQTSYFRALKIQLLRGRLFDQSDTPRSPNVIVVDDVFASTFFPGQDALGKRIRWGTEPNDHAEIIGIVRHINQWGLDQDDKQSLRAQMYQSFDQLEDAGIGTTNFLIARTSGAPLAVLPLLKDRLQQLDKDNVLYRPMTMDEVIAGSLATRRFTMLLLSSFAGLALLLAAIGLYGVISYLASRRTQEFGVRMALGAQRAAVLRMVLGEGARLAGAGLLIGVVAAIPATRAIASLLYGIRPTDPLTFLAVALVLLAVALAASFIPAHRATRIDPMQALRCD